MRPPFTGSLPGAVKSLSVSLFSRSFLGFLPCFVFLMLAILLFLR